MRKVKIVIKRKLIQPVKRAITQGTSPSEIAFTITTGAIFGIIPVIGINTFILVFIALRFKLNMVIIQAVNYLFYPVQLALYIPFIKAGQLIYNNQLSPQSMTDFLNITKENWLTGLKVFGSAHVFACLVWFLVSIPFSIGLYRVLLILLPNKSLQNN